MLIALLSCAVLVAVLDDETTVEPTRIGWDGGGYDTPQSANGRLMSRWSTAMVFETAVMDDDGEGAYGDIGGGTVCTFDGDGVMVGDTTVSPTADVEDARGTHALASTPEGLTLIDLQIRQSRRWDVAGVRVAELRAHGAVALTERDEVVWFDSEGEVNRFAAPGCRGLSLDRETDTAWLGCGPTLLATTAQESWSVPVELGVSRLTWSEGASALFVVSEDGATLSAVDLDGATIWSQTIADVVVGLVAVGGDTSVALLVEHESGNEVVLFDGETGAMLDAMPIDGDKLRGSREAPVLVVYGAYVSYVLDVETGD